MQTAQIDSAVQSNHVGARPWMQVLRAEVTAVTGLTSSSLAIEIERLVLADRRKDECLAMLSHELRSPLAAIQNAIAILRSPRGSDATVQAGMHELIDRQVRQMSLLAAGLLDVGGIARGQLQLQRARIDLVTVLIALWRRFNPTLTVGVRHYRRLGLAPAYGYSLTRTGWSRYS